MTVRPLEIFVALVCLIAIAALVIQGYVIVDSFHVAHECEAKHGTYVSGHCLDVKEIP